MKSIRAKIMLAVSAIVIIALAVQGVAVSQFVRDNLSKDAKAAFTESGRTLLGELSDMDRNISNTREMLMSGYDRDIKNITETAHSILAYNYELAQVEIEALTNDLSVEERDAQSEAITLKYQMLAKEAIRPMSYGGSGYLWIDNSEYVLQLLPPKPEAEGKYRGDLQDKTGKYIVQDLVNGAMEHDDFYYDYFFPKPGETLASRKRGFVKYFEPWKWVVGTGNYVTDIETELERKEHMENGHYQGKLEHIDENHFVTISDSDGVIHFSDDVTLVNMNMDMVNITSGKTVGEEIVSIEDEFYEFVIEDANGKSAYLGYVMYDSFHDRRILFARDISIVFGLIDKVVQAVLVVVGAMIVIGLLLSYVVASSITKPIVKMRAFTERVASGDLTETLSVKSKDEVGNLSIDLNAMVESLRDLVRESTEMSTLVNDTTDHLAEMSNQTSEAIDQVARAVEEIASGSTEQVKETEKGVHGAGSLEESSDQIHMASSEMQHAISGMKEKNQVGIVSMDALLEKQKESFATISEIDEVIQALANQIKQITTFTDTITAISEQTNLLALNASIEAARAGEHGRGFAVVADEIRKLAEESDASAKEIQELTAKISKDTSQVAVTVRNAEDIFVEQNKAVEASGKLFDELNASVDQSSSKLANVISAVEALTSVKDEMVDIVQNIYKVAESSAASSEEVSASVEEQTASMDEINNMAQQLKSHAQTLQNTMSKFRL